MDLTETADFKALVHSHLEQGRRFPGVSLDCNGLFPDWEGFFFQSKSQGGLLPVRVGLNVQGLENFAVKESRHSAALQRGLLRTVVLPSSSEKRPALEVPRLGAAGRGGGAGGAAAEQPVAAGPR